MKKFVNRLCSTSWSHPERRGTTAR